MAVVVPECGRWWLMDVILRLAMRVLGPEHVSSLLLVCDACASCDSGVHGIRVGHNAVDVTPPATAVSWGDGNDSYMLPLCRHPEHSVRRGNVVLPSERLNDWSVLERCDSEAALAAEGVAVDVDTGTPEGCATGDVTVLHRSVTRQLSMAVCRPEAPMDAMQRQGSDSAMGVVLADLARQLGDDVEVRAVTGCPACVARGVQCVVRRTCGV